MRKKLRRPLTVLTTAAVLTGCSSAEVQPDTNSLNSPNAMAFDCQAEAQAAKPLPSTTEASAAVIARAIMTCYDKAPEAQKDAREGSCLFDVKIADGGLLRFFAREDTDKPGRILEVGGSVYPDGDPSNSPSERIHIDRLLPKGNHWGMEEEHRTLGKLVTTAVVPNYGSLAPAKLIRDDGAQRREAVLMQPDAATYPAAQRLIDLLETPVDGSSAFMLQPIGTP